MSMNPSWTAPDLFYELSASWSSLVTARYFGHGSTGSSIRRHYPVSSVQVDASNSCIGGSDNTQILSSMLPLRVFAVTPVHSGGQPCPVVPGAIFAAAPSTPFADDVTPTYETAVRKFTAPSGDIVEVIIVIMNEGGGGGAQLSAQVITDGLIARLDALAAGSGAPVTAPSTTEGSGATVTAPSTTEGSAAPVTEPSTTEGSVAPVIPPSTTDGSGDPTNPPSTTDGSGIT